MRRIVDHRSGREATGQRLLPIPDDVIMMDEQDQIDGWIHQMQSGDMDQQREAARLLGGAGEIAVEPTMTALASSTDSDERWYLAVALARIGSPAIDPLITALRERRDPEFRRYAAASLAEIGEDAVDPLIGLLEVEGDPELRGFAASALTRIGEPAIDRLREAVEAGGTRGALAGLVLWRMEEPGVQALVGIYCPEGEAPPDEDASRSTRPEA